MYNYRGRIELGNDKYAYVQRDEFADSAVAHIDRIKRHWKPPKYFYHFQRGGHVSALKQHVGAEWFGVIDISGFFNSIRRHRISKQLVRLGYSNGEAHNFAVASTVCIDYAKRLFVLPYGFVQSPILASLVLDRSALGGAIRKLNQAGTKISVYVDDIVVSGASEHAVATALSDLKQAADKANFVINDAKSSGPARDIVAFNIQLNGCGIAITDQRMEQFYQSVLRNREGSVSRGIRGYVASVNSNQEQAMVDAFPRIFTPNAV